MTAKQARAEGVKPPARSRKKKVEIPQLPRAVGPSRIVIPGVPPSLNRWNRLHWAVQGETKQMWEDIVKQAIRGVGSYERPVVRITYRFNLRRKRDKDNYTPKFIMDGLVKAGIIADDNAEAVDLDWSIEIDKDNEQTIIEIREARQDEH